MPIFSGPSGNPMSLASAMIMIEQQHQTITELRRVLTERCIDEEEIHKLRRQIAELEADKAFLKRRAFPKPVEVTL